MKFGIRELIFMIVLIAMPVSSFWFVFKPQNQEIIRAKKEIEHKELMLEKLEQETAQTADLERINQEISDQVAKLEGNLPTEEQVDDILQSVAELAAQRSLTIDRIKAQPPVPSSRYMERPLEMTMLGDFDDFYSFLLDLERLDRITRVPSLDLKGTKEDGVLEANFTLSIYFAPDTTETTG